MKNKLTELLGFSQKSKGVLQVSVSNLRCQVLPFSELQGFSGKQIDFFPPCSFFRKYLEENQQAQIDFYNWMHHCLIDLQGWKIPKIDGGWQNGSLHRLIIQLHQENNLILCNVDEANPKLVAKAIVSRVNYYFSLFNQIRNSIKNGEPLVPILCYPKDNNDSFVIYDGHHRTAALRILGVTLIDVILKK